MERGAALETNGEAVLEFEGLSVPLSNERKYLGLILALVASLSIAVNSILIKIAIGKYNVFLVSLVRVQGVILPALLFMLHAKFY